MDSIRSEVREFYAGLVTRLSLSVCLLVWFLSWGEIFIFHNWWKPFLESVVVWMGGKLSGKLTEWWVTKGYKKEVKFLQMCKTTQE